METEEATKSVDGSDGSISTEIGGVASWPSMTEIDQGAMSGEGELDSSVRDASIAKRAAIAQNPNEPAQNDATSAQSAVTESEDLQRVDDKPSKSAPRIKRSALVKRRIVTSVPVVIPAPQTSETGNKSTSLGDGEWPTSAGRFQNSAMQYRTNCTISKLLNSVALFRVVMSGSP